MLSPLPRCGGRAQSSLKLARPYQPSPDPLPGRPAHPPFRGLLSVHSRYGLHARTATKLWPLAEGFRHFVTSMPAPVASGWSGRRTGLAPAGKTPPFTAHVGSGAARSRAPSGMTKIGGEMAEFLSFRPPSFVIPESPRERTAPGPTERRAMPHARRLPKKHASHPPTGPPPVA